MAHIELLISVPFHNVLYGFCEVTCTFARACLGMHEECPLVMSTCLHVALVLTARSYRVGLYCKMLLGFHTVADAIE